MKGLFKPPVDGMAKQAARAAAEGRSVFIVQFRGQVGHTAELSRPIGGVAEMIEAVEAQGWRVDHFTSVPYKDNMTVVCLFRRHEPGHVPPQRYDVRLHRTAPRPPCVMLSIGTRPQVAASLSP